MASGFIPNPAYLPQFRTALQTAITLKGREAEGYATANASWSSSIPGTIRTLPVGFGTVLVGFGPDSLGHLFEGGTQPRHTKSGAYRGVGPARPMLAPAADQAMSTPLVFRI